MPLPIIASPVILSALAAASGVLCVHSVSLVSTFHDATTVKGARPAQLPAIETQPAQNSASQAEPSGIAESSTSTAQDLLGAWSVDLRPTPEAAPYLVPLTFTSFDGESGTLAGTFYNGSAIENAAVNTVWGRVHFAFTTSDNSGVYFTTGTLIDGRLHGTTFSPARGFMAVWEGQQD